MDFGKIMFISGYGLVDLLKSSNKKELVELISKSFELNVTVVEKQTEKTCDRSLSTIYDDINKFDIPTLKDQLNELKDFSIKLYK